jgi:hypothetical protein
VVRVSDREPAEAASLPPLRGARRAIAIAWVIGVTALYLAVRVFGLSIVP